VHGPEYEKEKVLDEKKKTFRRSGKSKKGGSTHGVSTTMRWQKVTTPIRIAPCEKVDELAEKKPKIKKGANSKKREGKRGKTTPPRGKKKSLGGAAAS